MNIGLIMQMSAGIIIEAVRFPRLKLYKEPTTLRPGALQQKLRGLGFSVSPCRESMQYGCGF